MNLSEIFKEALLEAKKKKPSAGLTKKQKSDVAKKAKAGEDIGKKGKGFEKLAKKAGGGEKGEKIAAAAMWKNTKRENVNEAIDPDALYELASLLWTTYKTVMGPKIFRNFKPALEAMKNAKDDKQKWEVIKTYAKHLINPVSNPFKNLFKDKESPDSKLEAPPVNEGEDHEVSMAHNSLKSIIQSCVELMDRLGDDERNLPGWIQDHITNAENYIDQAAQGFHELGDHDDDDSEESEMIQPVDEKKLTKDEKTKKNQILKAMEKEGGGKKKMGPKQYAIATAQAIKSAE
jgi:hypothetical protein